MAESELGTAVLSLRVETGPALQALTQFRQQVERELQNSGTINFRGLEENARQSGQRAGRALADGVTQATRGLRFDSISDALDFSDALNGTLRDLRQYRDALVALREVTNATAPGFYELNDAIEATSQAIRNYSSGTDALQDQAARNAARELTQEMRRQRDAVLENARADRQWGDAIRTIEGAQRSAAAATREANQAFRDQVSAVGSLAQKGARDIGGTIGAVGRGVGAAARGAVNLGRAGYNLGAEFGVFEEPRTGPVKKAIQEVVDRFRFLGEQAETTRGIILRSFEGAGAAAGLAAIAQNADQLKAALNGLSTAAKATDTAVGGIAKFGQYLADVFNNGGWLTDNGNTIIGQLLNISAATEKAGAAAVSLGDQLVQLGAGAAGGALNGIQAVVDAIGGLPPEAQAAVLALAGLSVGFKEKPIVDGLTTVLEYLDNLKSKSLQVRGDLSAVLQGLDDFQQKLSTGKDQNLLPAFTERGLQVLDDSVRQGESFRRISDSIGSSWERGARYLEKSNDELRRLIDQGLELKQLGIGPSGVVPQQTNLLPPGAPASFRPDPNAYERPIGPALPSQLFEDDLAAVQARRLAVEQDIAEAKAETLRLAEIENRRGREIGRLNAVGVDGRLPTGGFAPGSPGALSARNRQLREAGSNALIGGAFPALFGQGLGASVGGALGGGAGGLVGGQFGFGLSLLGTALGSQFDLATQKLQTLGSALSDPVKQFSALTEAGLISSKGLEKQIQALIDTGREAEAAALIQKDLASTYGDLDAAKDLAAENDRLARTYSQLQTRLAEFVAGPLARFVEVVNRGLGGSPGTNENGVGFTSFRKQVDQIGKERGRSVAADLVRRQIAEEARIASRDRGSAILGDLTFGLFGNGRGARSEQAAKAVLDQAAAEGIITQEQAKQNTLLAAARQNYADLNTLAYQQATAQAQGNKELELSLRRRQIILQLLKDSALLDDSNDPGGVRRQALTDKAKQDIFALDEQLKALTNGSLTDLQERLSQLNNQRLRVPVESEQFKTLGVDIEALKTRIEELQRTPLRLDSIAGLQQQISDLETRQIKLSVDSSAFTAANQKILETQNALEQLDGKKAIITVEQINAGVQDGSLTNNFSNLEKRSQAAQQALNTAAFGSPDFQKALRAAQEANFELDQRRKAADPAAFTKVLDDSASRVKEAFGKVEQASEALTSAQEGLRSSLEGAFDLLSDREQGALLSAAKRDLQQAVDARIFDGGKVAKLSDKELIGAASQARGIFKANENLNKANNDLVEVNADIVASNIDLIKATQALTKKNWGVMVAVNANTGDYAVNLG